MNQPGAQNTNEGTKDHWSHGMNHATSENTPDVLNQEFQPNAERNPSPTLPDKVDYGALIRQSASEFKETETAKFNASTGLEGERPALFANQRCQQCNMEIAVQMFIANQSQYFSAESGWCHAWCIQQALTAAKQMPVEDDACMTQTTDTKHGEVARNRERRIVPVMKSEHNSCCKEM